MFLKNKDIYKFTPIVKATTSKNIINGVKYIYTVIFKIKISFFTNTLYHKNVDCRFLILY
jgi:hypothetical protein